MPETSIPAALLPALRQAIGADHVATAEAVALLDVGWNPQNLAAGIVVSPGSTQEVAAVVRLCAQHGISLVPQAGRTGLVGGSVSQPGQIVLSLLRMNQIEPIDAAERLGLKVVARVVAHAAHAQEPGQFATAPVPAIRKVLQRAGWSVADVDLFEVNEAFAVVAMVAEQELGLDRARLNVNGGACALGHPIGASGARILATLLAALEARGGRKGVASLCIGGGEATAMAVELI
jgi:acetyl-CoA acetyltransferase